MNKFSFKVTKHKSIFRGRAVNLAVDTLRFPGGKLIEREIIYHPGSAVMIPILNRDSLILIRQFRYSIGKFIWEFPAGTMEPGEKPLSCAKRELEEEIGYRARLFRKLATFYPTPGVSTEVMHLYLATGLTKTKSSLEDDELLSVKVWRIRDIDRMIRSGKIRDGKTILGFLQLRKIYDGSGSFSQTHHP